MNTPGVNTPSANAQCNQVELISFAIGVEHEDPIHRVVPGSTPPPIALTLAHVSGLSTTQADLCKGASTAIPPCSDFDAFTWGYDWIPLATEQTDDTYCLDSLMNVAEGEPGWAVMYFAREKQKSPGETEIFALGWGESLDLRWPLDSQQSINGPNGAIARITASGYPEVIKQIPLHTVASMGYPYNPHIEGLDFHAWVSPIGEASEAGCFELPPGHNTDKPRLYFSVPYQAGADTSGTQIWWREPENPRGNVWMWSRPRLLCTNAIPGLSLNDDIEALSFDRRLIPDGRGGTQSHLMFSLKENLDPAAVVEGTEPIEAGHVLYIVPVSGLDGAATFGQPKPVFMELPEGSEPPTKIPMRTIIGPRSRGVCPTDPLLYVPSRRPIEASSKKEASK